MTFPPAMPTDGPRDEQAPAAPRDEQRPACRARHYTPEEAADVVAKIDLPSRAAACSHGLGVHVVADLRSGRGRR